MRSLASELRARRLERLFVAVLFTIALSLGVVGIESAGGASVAQIAGAWDVTVEGQALSDDGFPSGHCVYEGQAIFEQSGTELAVRGGAALTRGGQDCRGRIAGEGVGRLNGLTIEWGFATQGTDVASFSGTVDPGCDAMSGSWSGLGFAGSGTWAATREPTGCGDEETSADFDWSMPERFGFDDDGDGLADYYPPSGNLIIEPDSWRVDFVHGDVASCDGDLSRKWSIDGQEVFAGYPGVISYDPSSCEFSFAFPNEGVYEVELRVRDQAGEPLASAIEDVVVQDWLIVSVGDSVASGEGVPDRSITPTLSEPQWQSERCHRSANAGPAEAARNLENADPRTSVTFVHLACSGADIVSGLLRSYRGIEPGTGEPRPPAQIEQANALVGTREIDAILISIGANDIRFSDIVTRCALIPDCHLSFGNSLLQSGLAALPSRFDALHALMTSQIGLPNVDAARVYITEYFDPTRFDDSSVCGGESSQEVLYDHPLTGSFFGVSQVEAEWASQVMLPALNEIVQAKANDFGWNYVGAIRGNFLFNGYCATVPYVVTYAGSQTDQGDEYGTLHPNLLGHAIYANGIGGALAEDLYQGGDLSKPREPVEG